MLSGSSLTEYRLNTRASHSELQSDSILSPKRFLPLFCYPILTPAKMICNGTKSLAEALLPSLQNLAVFICPSGATQISPTLQMPPSPPPPPHTLSTVPFPRVPAARAVHPTHLAFPPFGNVNHPPLAPAGALKSKGRSVSLSLCIPQARGAQEWTAGQAICCFYKKSYLLTEQLARTLKLSRAVFQLGRCLAVLARRGRGGGRKVLR